MKWMKKIVSWFCVPQIIFRECQTILHSHCYSTAWGQFFLMHEFAIWVMRGKVVNSYFSKWRGVSATLRHSENVPTQCCSNNNFKCTVTLTLSIYTGVASVILGKGKPNFYYIETMKWLKMMQTSRFESWVMMHFFRGWNIFPSTPLKASLCYTNSENFAWMHHIYIILLENTSFRFSAINMNVCAWRRIYIYNL